MKFQSNLKTLGQTIMVEKPKWVNLEDGEYEIEFKAPDESKTNRQRNYFFALVKDIARAQDGDASNYLNWYGVLLKMAQVKVTGIKIKKEALNLFKTLCKYFVVMEEDGEWATVEVYKGISEMNKKEVGELIDVTLKLASRLGVKTDNYYNLKGGD